MDSTEMATAYGSSYPGNTMRTTVTMEVCSTRRQGLTLVHFSVQRKRYSGDKGGFGRCLGGIHSGVEVVFRRLRDALSGRNASG